MKKVSIALMALGLLLLSGCTPSFTVDDLYGTWTHIGRLFQFNEDGTYVVAASVDGLTSAPLIYGDFRLEGTRLTYIPDEESSRCAGTTGIYEVEAAENGRFKSTLIEDDCISGSPQPSAFFTPYEP